MEVHHHSHTPRKNWTHYFWEFLMLFLAVFAGFLAENEREHFIEHKREKKLIKEMVEDLKKDTVYLNLCVNRFIPNHLILLDSAKGCGYCHLYFVSRTADAIGYPHLHLVASPDERRDG